MICILLPGISLAMLATALFFFTSFSSFLHLSSSSSLSKNCITTFFVFGRFHNERVKTTFYLHRAQHIAALRVLLQLQRLTKLSNCYLLSGHLMTGLLTSDLIIQKPSIIFDILKCFWQLQYFPVKLRKLQWSIYKTLVYLSKSKFIKLLDINLWVLVHPISLPRKYW